MDNTFTSLGLPFPLFEGLVSEAVEYGGIATCSLCNESEQHCFNLDVGCAIMTECPGCAALNGLDAADREDTKCRSCDVIIRFPALDEEIQVCYACLRRGNATISKDTELGMISWEQAVEGITHGRPSLSDDNFELVQTRDGLTGAKLSPDIMFELLCTPTYSTWQGERWQFCCKHPMIFVGNWAREEFSAAAPDADGKTFFEQTVQDTVPGLWEEELHDETGVYVFQCPHCERFTAHWDIA